MQKPTTNRVISVPALTKPTANRPAITNAAVAVFFLPNFSSANIMNKLAQGKASVMPNVKVSDLVMVMPRSAIMFGSQVPSPSATPKNATKQTMAAIRRPR